MPMEEELPIHPCHRHRRRRSLPATASLVLSRGLAVLLLVCAQGESTTEASTSDRPGSSSVHEDNSPTYLLLEVLPSSIPGAGLGIFLSAKSKATMKQGTVVTHYGGRLVRADEAHGKVDMQVYSLAVPDRPGYVSVGEPWGDKPVPSYIRLSSSGGTPVGHLLNDAAAITKAGVAARAMGRGLPALSALEAEYTEKSERLGNVAFTGRRLEMHAVRDIQPGEELFLSYGAEYWLNYVLQEAEKDPLTKLFVYLHMTQAHADIFTHGYIYHIMPPPQEEEEEKKKGLTSSAVEGLPSPLQLPRLMWSSGAEVKEQTCQSFMAEYLQVKGKQGRKLLKRLGLLSTTKKKGGSEGAMMSSKEILQHLAAHVLAERYPEEDGVAEEQRWAVSEEAVCH